MAKIKNSLYRFLNKENKIIYIGKAVHLKARLNNHNHLPETCYNEIQNIEYTTFETEDECLFAERYYISKIKPKYNTVFKDKDILFELKELDNRLWNTLTYKKDSEKPSKSIEEQIEDIKTSLEELNKEYTIKLDVWRKLTEDFHIIDLKVAKERKESIDDIYKKNKEAALIIFPNYEELIAIEKSMNQLSDCIAELNKQLDVLLKKQIRNFLGKEKYDALSKTQLKYYLKYNTFSDETTLIKILSDIELDLFNETKKTIDSYGFYNYTHFCISVDSKFTYTGHSPENDWLFLAEVEEIIKDKQSTEKTNKMAEEMKLSLENRLTKEYGEFKLEVLIENSTGVLGALKGVKNKYPYPMVIKRPIFIKSNLKKLDWDVVGT